MNRSSLRVVLLAGVVATLAVVSLGCRHTADGVKADTKKAVEKTGAGIEKAGEKIENAGKK